MNMCYYKQHSVNYNILKNQDIWNIKNGFCKSSWKFPYRSYCLLLYLLWSTFCTTTYVLSTACWYFFNVSYIKNQRNLYSLGGTTRAQWEDVTGSTPLTFVNDCVSFTTTVSARFWLMDCRNISDATKMATELYK